MRHGKRLTGMDRRDRINREGMTAFLLHCFIIILFILSILFESALGLSS
jgi:hypothetical protein